MSSLQTNPARVVVLQFGIILPWGRCVPAFFPAVGSRRLAAWRAAPELCPEYERLVFMPMSSSSVQSPFARNVIVGQV